MTGRVRRRLRAGGALAAVILVMAAAVLCCWYGYRDGWFLPRWVEWKSGALVPSENGVSVPAGESGGLVSAGESGVSVPAGESGVPVSAGESGVSVPAGENGVPAQAAGNAPGDMKAVLAHRAVRVFSGGRCIWTSPENVKVQDALCCDIDGDGGEELLLLCWKIGRYGTIRPFWVKNDEKSWSQHLFVYHYEPDGITPKWMSSYMGTDVAGMSVSVPEPAGGTRPDGTPTAGSRPGGTPAEGASSFDGEASGGAGTGRRYLLLVSPGGGVSRWFWDSWGFTKEID